MKNFKIVILLCAIILVAIFAVQNSAAVTIRFLTWHLNISQALIIIFSAALGVLIGLALSLIKSFHHNRDMKAANLQKADAQAKIEALERENLDLNTRVKLMRSELEKRNVETERMSEEITQEKTVQAEEEFSELSLPIQETETEPTK